MTNVQSRYQIISVSMLILAYIFTWKIQASLLLNSDVSWLSLAAKRLLAGGSYSTDFYETNPPLIIYLYTPVIFLQYFFHLNEMLALRIYVFLISGASLFCCMTLLKNIIKNTDQLVKFILIGTLCSIFLIIPISDFGQREHLTVLLITPYILLVAARLCKQPVAYKFEISIGIMAGIGFAIKPYFYLPLLLVELYYAYSVKHISAFLRTETLIIGLIACVYLNIILLFNYDYISVILPLIKQTYYLKYNTHIALMLSNEQSIFLYFLIAFYCIRYPYNNYRQLSNILLISTVGFWLVFLWQQMGWFYHSLPFYAYALLLYSLLFSGMITQQSLSKIECITVTAFSLLLLTYYYFYMPYISLGFIYDPSMVFILYGAIFTILLYVSHQQRNEIKVGIAILLIFTLNIVFYYYLSITTLSKYLFILSNIMLFLNFLLVLPRAKWHYGYLSVVGISIFIYPFYKAANILSYSQSYQKSYQHMIDDMKPYANKKVYFFTPASELVFPLIQYAHLDYASRFWSMAWLPMMKNPDGINQYESFYRSNRHEIDFYINIILTDFAKYNPTIVFVDRRAKGYFFNISPNYIALFSKNNSFRSRWRDYHFVKVIDFPPLYKFAIYSNESADHA